MPSELVPLEDPSTFRKIAAAMWVRPNDPTIYGYTDIDMTRPLKWLEEYRARVGAKVTVTHMMARALAIAFARHPELNAKVAWWGKLYRRTTVDVFIQVTTDGGRDLSGARIDACEKKTVADIARELASKAKEIRTGGDASYKKSRDLFKWLPWWLIRPVLKVSSLLTNELHLDLSGQGMPRDPFGTAMVTNVGGFSIDTGFAPFTPIARCPLLVLLPEIRPRPWVTEDRRLEVRPVLRSCATADHRVIDGHGAGVLNAEVLKLFERPELLDEPAIREEKAPDVSTAPTPAAAPAGAAPAPPPEASAAKPA